MVCVLLLAGCGLVILSRHMFFSDPPVTLPEPVQTPLRTSVPVQTVAADADGNAETGQKPLSLSQLFPVVTPDVPDSPTVPDTPAVFTTPKALAPQKKAPIPVQPVSTFEPKTLQKDEPGHPASAPVREQKAAPVQESTTPPNDKGFD